MQTHIVAKTIIFNDRGQLLVLLRSDDDTHRPGGSDIPGGKVEENEDIVAGVIRETAEEAGVHLRPNDLHLIFASTNAAYNEDNKTEINIVWLGFAAKLPANQVVRIGADHKKFDWCNNLNDALTSCDAPTHRAFFAHIRDNKLIKGLRYK